MSDPDASEQTDPGEEIETIDEETEGLERDEASAMARLGVYAVPVAIAHLALIYFVMRAAFGFEVPRFLRADMVVAWLWVNGAALALGAWMWRKGRVPVAPGRWLKGRRARLSILLWLGLSLAWFLLPALLGEAGQWLTGVLG